MKILTVAIFLLTFRLSIAQNIDADLNGMEFSVTITEVISPEADKVPLVFTDIIIFEDGKIYFDMLNRYSAFDRRYTSEVDYRRMIAAKVVLFNSDYSGTADGKEISIAISGEVIGDKSLSGIITVKYKDRQEGKFKIESQNN